METVRNVFTLPYRIVGWLPVRYRGKKCENLTAEERLEMKLRPYQNYLFKFQELLLWKNSYESILFVAFVNIIFFFLAWMKWRFYGVVIWTILTLVIHEAWVYNIWPEIRAENTQPLPRDNPSTQQPTEGMLSVPELSKCAACIHSIVTSIFINLKSLRTNHPSVFCSMMASLFLVVAQVGSAVSGFWLLYMLVMFIILTPGIMFHLVTPKTREWLANIILQFASFLQPKETDTEVEEYLPEQNKENLSLFNLASGDIVEKTNVSTPGSDMDVLPGEPIPSYDESSIDRDFSLSFDPSDLQSMSQLAETALRFRPTHFNGSTLSAALRQALADTLGPNLVASSATQHPILEHSDSDNSDSSEFELLEPEEDSPTT